ncbi:hypothetical protein ACA910_001937 [Epithemia clementina (nom. ined.)]
MSVQEAALARPVLGAVKETEHARQRRLQRGIDMKMDLETVLKHGQIIPCEYGIAFKYKDIIYVLHRTRKGKFREATCYAVPISLKKIKISKEMSDSYSRAVCQLQNDPALWKSNTVIVVDTSGSMRKADVWGCRTRLHAVWMTVALDFIAHRLESGNGGLYDLVSIIALGESAEVIVETKPTSWILYNKVVELYQGFNNLQVRPEGHGYYIPSIKKAEEILTQNKSASCCLALCFISDGRPSDFIRCGDMFGEITATVQSLGRAFGRRLTFTTVGIGSNENGQEFETLQSMAETAKDYGVLASFQLPSMTSAALGDVLTLTATSLTKTQTEMTDLSTLKQQNVRDVARESRKKASEEAVVAVSNSEYFLYPMEKVTRYVYKEWHDDERKRHESYEIAPPQNPEARFVAMNKAAFGEGAERFAFRFFEVGADGQTVLGKPLVAKESRLVLEGGASGREKFVKTFCKTQQLARRIALEFNTKLDNLRRVSDSTPRVTFLDCSVYQLDDKKLGKQSVLVEEKLENTAWHKWNANNGFVEGMKEAPEFSYDKMLAACDHLAKIDLGAIEEGEEDDEDHEEEGNHGFVRRIVPKTFSASEVAQAFSHYSYYATGKKRLICDLQGVFDVKENLLKFSDPVIHYYNPGKSHKRSVHGRTDLGRKGMFMFFGTHKDCCGHLCRLVTGGFRQRRHHHHLSTQHPSSQHQHITTSN